MVNSVLVYFCIRNSSSKDSYHTKLIFIAAMHKETSSTPQMKFASHTLFRENKHQVDFQSLPRHEHQRQNVNAKKERELFQ